MKSFRTIQQEVVIAAAACVSLLLVTEMPVGHMVHSFAPCPRSVVIAHHVAVGKIAENGARENVPTRPISVAGMISQATAERRNKFRYGHGFTLVEMLSSIAIIAILVVCALPYFADLGLWAHQVSDHWTLTTLNDALDRYKGEGGNVPALTAGAPISHVIPALQTPVNWAGTTHQFLQSGFTIPARSLFASGNGSSYQFTAFNTYIANPGGSSPHHGIVSFTNIGTTSWTVPPWVTSVEVLVVAGGGGGGYWCGGGGGAGGVIHQTDYGVTPSNSITVTVGGGGTGALTFIVGGNGGNSVFGTLTAIGGGGGGSWDINGNSGGSGGGGGTRTTGSSTGGNGSSGQGNIGGAGAGSTAGGGGGGAGVQGGLPTGGYGGAGGDGLPFSISGNPTYYGGGGGGNATGGSTGGLGGGGSGNNSSNGGSSGTPNTGSGGSGVVIVSY